MSRLTRGDLVQKIANESEDCNRSAINVAPLAHCQNLPVALVAVVAVGGGQLWSVATLATVSYVVVIRPTNGNYRHPFDWQSDWVPPKGW